MDGSRRDLIKKAAVAGGLVWATPVIQSVSNSAAAAGTPEPTTTSTTQGPPKPFVQLIPACDQPGVTNFDFVLTNGPPNTPVCGTITVDGDVVAGPGCMSTDANGTLRFRFGTGGTGQAVHAEADGFIDVNENAAQDPDEFAFTVSASVTCPPSSP